MTDLFRDLFATGRIVDAILVLVAVEAVGLLAWRRYTGRGPAPFPLLCNLASGASLMLAVRAALTGADWLVVAECLLLSLVAHVTEVGMRLRETRGLSPRRDGDPKIRDGGTTSKIVTFSGRRHN